MEKKTSANALDSITAGGALLARLKAVGVDYLFCNSGTDFPPIIEGLAEAAAKDIPLPQALIMPHDMNRPPWASRMAIVWRHIRFRSRVIC